MRIVPASRVPVEEEAILADRYLESLLDAAERHALDVPVDPALDPALRETVRRLRHELVRVHPSFRFEERLGQRLAGAAGRVRPRVASATNAVMLPFPAGPRSGGATGSGSADRRPWPVMSWPAVSRPLVIGGALTSAALSLAGAALVAWRVTHGPRRIA